MKKKLAFFDLVVIALLILFCIIFIYPLWTIFVATFSSPLDYVKNPLAMWPENFTVYNFGKLLTSQNVWTGYKNTLIYTGLGTLIDVSMTFVMAYALSLKELPWRRPISFLITLTLFFSGGMIPTYLIIKAYGMLNSIWAMVLPGAIATYNLMITRTYLSQQIPGELVEAAEVDGARRPSHISSDCNAAGQAHSGGYHAVLCGGSLEWISGVSYVSAGSLHALLAAGVT